MSKAVAADIVRQLEAAGYLTDLEQFSVGQASLSGVLRLQALDRLRQDPRFLEGIFHWLHPEVGWPRTEFRSITNALGAGSLQLVINTETGAFYCDLDRHNTQDVVNIIGHFFGAVIPGWWRQLFRRRTE